MSSHPPPAALPPPASSGGDGHAPTIEQILRAAIADHQAPLLRYATRLLSGDEDRARDVVQDSFIRLSRQQPEAVQGHVAEWLYTVCRNRATDVLRKEGRMTALTDYHAATIPAAEARPGSQLESQEAAGDILRLVSRLPHNQQEVVRLKFQQGFSYREIATITGLSVGNVGFLLHTAVQRLRREWHAARDR